MMDIIGIDKIATIMELTCALLDYTRGDLDKQTIDRIFYAQTNEVDDDFKEVVYQLFKWAGIENF